VSADPGALADSAIDVSAEVAALRSIGGRRPWALMLLAAAGILGLIALTAPRERTVALLWLREAYASRTQSAAQALLPIPALEAPPSGSDIGPREPLAAPTSDNGAAPLLPGSTEPTAAGAVPPAVNTEETKAEPPATALQAVIQEGMLQEAAPQGAAPQETATARAVEPVTAAAGSAVALAAKASPRVARASGSRARPVAATRKRSPRAAALALGRTKPRSTRQNSTRKDGGSGIIRQTPF
jgi:hypothetical protein